MQNKPKDINLRIATYRKLAGYTQAEAARALGLNRSTYGQMELHGNPRYDMILKLSELYNISVDTLLKGIAEPSAPATVSTPIIEAPPPLKEEPDKDISPPAFLPTATEISIIKAYRSLSKQSKQEVRNFINEVYHKSKS